MVRETTILLTAVVALVAFGTLMVYSAAALNPDAVTELTRQPVYMALGFIAMFIASRFDYRHFKDPILYRGLVFISLTFLVLVLIPGIGTNVDGGQRWLRLGPAGFQPSEIAKFVLIVWLAVKLTDSRDYMNTFFRGFLPSILIAGLFTALVLAERDLGVPIVMMSAVFVMLFVAGTRWQYLVICVMPCLAGASMLVALAPHRVARVLAFLDPYEHRDSAGWHLIQSFSAFAQGSIWGRGPGASEQKLGYLPAAHTDFIFAVVGEEFGLAGTLTLVMVFALLLWMGFRIAFNARDRFGSLLATGIVVSIGVQTVFIMCVTTGLLPTKGLPLPFISYGGTALIVMMGMAGVLANIGSQAIAPARVRKLVAAPSM